MEWLEDQFNDDSTLGRLSQWWKQANNLKNSGFYVDFVNSKWESPKDITKEQFEVGREHILYLIEKIDWFKHLILEKPDLIKNSYLENIEKVDKKDKE